MGHGKGSAQMEKGRQSEDGVLNLTGSTCLDAGICQTDIPQSCRSEKWWRRGWPLEVQTSLRNVVRHDWHHVRTMEGMKKTNQKRCPILYAHFEGMKILSPNKTQGVLASSGFVVTPLLKKRMKTSYSTF